MMSIGTATPHQHSRSVLKRITVLGATLGVVGAAVACDDNDGEYPSGSVEYIIPYDPGGGADPVGRQFTEMLMEELGGSADILNVPGGDEAVGITQLANSDPDGYTLGLGTPAGFIAQPLINSDAQYSGTEDFTPIAKLSSSPHAIFVSADSDFETLEDLIDEASENPGEIRISSPSRMGAPAFGVYFLEDQADINVNLIATSGGAGEAALEVMSGRLDAFVANASAQLGLVESGDLRALAYTGDADYSEFLPDAVSYEEAGYDIPFVADYLTFAPADAPEEVESALVEAADSILTGDEWAQWNAEQGALADVATGEELDTYLEEIETNLQRGIELAESREE